jgi:hypothetical protein
MIIIRLIPVYISVLLLSAHLLRIYGLYPALLLLLLLFTFLIRKRWILQMWQFILFISVLMWINTVVTLVHFRLAMDMPWVRLAVIMVVVIAFTIYSGFWLENNKIKKFYDADPK